ncbi:MAG: transposase [Spirochaetales bacterium]|nr:transposase [Spirochaetales bacterium]
MLVWKFPSSAWVQGVSNSFSRPRVSDDNPFIESFFKTMKYSLKYPGRFSDLPEARQWVAEFVNWYNTEHLHSVLGYVTPAQRRSGEDITIFKTRNGTMKTAKEQHPERWSTRPVRVWLLEDTVILNPDKNQKSDAQPILKAS